MSVGTVGSRAMRDARASGLSRRRVAKERLSRRGSTDRPALGESDRPSVGQNQGCVMYMFGIIKYTEFWSHMLYKLSF